MEMNPNTTSISLADAEQMDEATIGAVVTRCERFLKGRNVAVGSVEIQKIVDIEDPHIKYRRFVFRIDVDNTRRCLELHDEFYTTIYHGMVKNIAGRDPERIDWVMRSINIVFTTMKNGS
jgi:hypothetical protein